MSEFDYSGFENQALRMLRKFGRPLEVRAYSSTGFDPVEGVYDLKYYRTTGFAISVPSVTTGYKFFDDFIQIVFKSKLFAFVTYFSNRFGKHVFIR